MNNVVFVAGVHGVGKSTLCGKVIEPLDIRHLTASEIIKKYKQDLIENKTKYAANIDMNQYLLIKGLNKEITDQPLVILDGHFALLDQNGEITAINTAIFGELSLCAIVIITDDPIKIENRLFLRDATHYNVDSLAKMQEIELQQAMEVALSLNLALLIIDLVEGQEDSSSILASFLSTYM